VSAPVQVVPAKTADSRQMTDTESGRKWRRLIRRIVLTALALGIWFWTQSLISHRPAPTAAVGDALHTLTAGLNSYFYHSPSAANALLIVSSALIDGLALFLLGRWLFGPSVRPFLGLVLLLGLRQIMQAICALPAPPNMIWHYPGFPSLLVTYNIGNDFFFSGHTAIAVFGGIELKLLPYSSCVLITRWTSLPASSQHSALHGFAPWFRLASTPGWRPRRNSRYLCRTPSIIHIAARPWDRRAWRAALGCSTPRAPQSSAVPLHKRMSVGPWRLRRRGDSP
jgi:hypothetical protein